MKTAKEHLLKCLFCCVLPIHSFCLSFPAFRKSQKRYFGNDEKLILLSHRKHRNIKKCLSRVWKSTFCIEGNYFSAFLAISSVFCIYSFIFLKIATMV